MRYVYENNEEAKQKGINARKTVEHTFSWHHTIEKVNISIAELKLKPVFRLNIETIKKDLLENGLKSFENNDYKHAEAIFKELLGLDNSESNYYYNLGLSQLKQEKYEEAVDSLSESLDLGLSNSNIFNYLGYCLEKMGDSEISQLFYQKAGE